MNKTIHKKPNKSFTITKRIAKHGSQSIIVIPRILESHLKPGTITEVTINVIESSIENQKTIENPGLNLEEKQDGSNN